MASITCTRADSSAPVGPRCKALIQQAKLHIEVADREIELKMKEELLLATNEQVVLHEDVEMTTNGFTNQLIALENSISSLKISSATCRSEPGIRVGFAIYIGTLR